MNKNVNFLDKNLFEIINIIDSFLIIKINLNILNIEYIKIIFHFIFYEKILIHILINLIIQNFYLNKRKFLYN